jgi:pyridoxine kinase
VIGDVGRGAFVKSEAADFIRLAAVPAADIVTPNHFELEQLVARPVRTRLDARSAVDAVRGFGPKVVLVTSLATVEMPASSIDLMAADAMGHYRVRTPRLSVASHGAGDAIAALFLANYLRQGSAAEALSRSASSIFGVLKRTAALGAEEMALVEAQDELVNPGTTFRAEPF